MKPDLMTQLPRSQREAVESAGYRVVRWAAARGVLQTRVEKKRIAGPLGDFLAHWLSLAPQFQEDAELWLSFNYALDPVNLKLGGGSASLVRSPLERALLHLPALRRFWRQELRLQHFEALRALVPQAWLLDPAQVPPGAVIQGLGTPSWDHAQSEGKEIKDGILILRPSSGVVLNARYGRNEAGQVVLRTIEEASP